MSSACREISSCPACAGHHRPITVPLCATFELTIGYISGENRNITVTVNGRRVQTLNVNSGGWSTVGKRKLKINLDKGYNTIRLSNATNWMPDIDYIDLKFTGVSSVEAPTAQKVHAGAAYDLAGRKTNAANARGIVIENGHKRLNY